MWHVGAPVMGERNALIVVSLFVKVGYMRLGVLFPHTGHMQTESSVPQADTDLIANEIFWKQTVEKVKMI